MNLATNIILLLVGVSVFLIGMNMMSDGLKKATGPKMKKLFDKFKNSRFAGLGVGVATTAVIQSSAATSIMAIGFINAGIMTMFQAISIIMGAYIGTTVTGLLVSLSSFSGNFDINVALLILAFIGVLLQFFKNKTAKNIGLIASGLGLLFFGLFTLKNAFNYSEINSAISNLFKIISNPVLLLVIGALLTMLVQSSSASTGIMIVMASTGAVGVESAIYIALGATIGTVITTILASISGSVNSKRVAIAVLIMRIILALIALAILWPLDASFGIFENLLDWFGRSSVGLFIAVFMVIYNVITMFAMLPFIEMFEKLACKIIKDKKNDQLTSQLKYIDEKMLNSPDVALMQVKKEIIHMSELAFENYKRGIKAIINTDLSELKEIKNCEDTIDFLNEKITDFLIKLTAHSSVENEKIIGGYYHAINDIERIGDHASNFIDNAIKMHDLNLKFSEIAVKELSEFDDVLNNMFNMTNEILNSGDINMLKELHGYEDKTDELKVTISNAHFDRITKGTCTVEVSPFLSTLVSELERIGDHLTNVGYIVLNPTGKDK